MKISKHCLKRLKKRGISKREVREAVSNGKYKSNYTGLRANKINMALRVKVYYKDLTVIKEGGIIVTAWRQ